MRHRMMACAAAFAGLSIVPVWADPVADFYKGKNINMLIGVSAGGEYDLHARLIARYIGRHIPGNPTLVPQNMLGAGGIFTVSRRATVPIWP
jgi:tripartite-type tricarboxylate transporter receptor subunit TctC